MSRPPVDVVVPFRGDRDDLEQLKSRLTRLRRRPDDTITIVDNTPGHPPGKAVTAAHFASVGSAYHGRSAGVASYRSG